MYRIEADHEKKLIKVELSGNMDVAEIKAYTSELIEALKPLKEKEYSLIANLVRLDPVGQDCLPYLQDCMKLVLRRLDKIAAVHKRVVTKMQMTKLERKSKTDCFSENNIMRFDTMNEAFSYIRKSRS